MQKPVFQTKKTMKKIFKFPVPIQDLFKVSMPVGSEILTVQIDQKTETPTIWVKVDVTKPTVERRFTVIATGREFADSSNNLIYIGTFQMDHGQFVAHLFEILS